MQEEMSEARRLGPYLLKQEAGRGGMATVYEAEDTRDGKTVAVKVLALVSEHSPEERHKQQTRLSREAQAISRLQHPNIVEMLDVVIADTPGDNTHYLVMEYVAGETLKERLERTGPLPIPEAMPVLEQVGQALDAVHSAGIVHRDIKPSNIMLLPDGTAKLMDFGVARLTDDTKVTRTGMVIGSPAYMSPEQATSQPATALSDLWSLTAVFYEMLTGQPAFRGENIPAVLYQVAYGRPASLPPASPTIQRVFRRFQPIFDKAFSREPGERFESGAALVAAFQEALTAPEPEVVTPRVIPAPPVAPIAAPPVSQAPRRRRAMAFPRWVPVAALVPAVLGFFAIGTWWPRAEGKATPPSVASPSASAPQPAPARGATAALAPPVIQELPPKAPPPQGKPTPKPPAKVQKVKKSTKPTAPRSSNSRRGSASSRGRARVRVKKLQGKRYVAPPSALYNSKVILAPRH
jgi:serine/threonine protein kinase